MGKEIFMLLWAGISFLAIGLWMRKKDKDGIEEIHNKMVRKEKDLYELYWSLEEIMNEMGFIYTSSKESDSKGADSERQDGEPAYIGEERYNENIAAMEKNRHEKKSAYHVETNKMRQVGHESEKISPIGEKGKATAVDQPIRDDREQKVDRYKKIKQLAEKGYSEDEIAKKLKLGKGEVKLFLGLNKE